MKKLFLATTAALFIGATVYGCSNTEEGVKADAKNDATTVQKSADQAVDATKKAADTAVANTKQAADVAVDKTKKAADAVVSDTKMAADKTVNATKRAVDNTVASTKEAADNASKATKDAGKNITGAVEVAPSIRAALDADPELADQRNHWTASDKDGVVHLSGTVHSKDLVKKAGDLASKKLKEMNSTDKLSNELKVGAGSTKM